MLPSHLSSVFIEIVFAKFAALGGKRVDNSRMERVKFDTPSFAPSLEKGSTTVESGGGEGGGSEKR